MTNLQRAFMEITRSLSLVADGSRPMPGPNHELDEKWRNLERTVEEMCIDIVEKAVEEKLEGMEDQLNEPWSKRLQAVGGLLIELEEKLKARPYSSHVAGTGAMPGMKEERSAGSKPPKTTKSAGAPIPSGAQLRLAVTEVRQNDILPLLDAGVNINSPDTSGRTALYLAVNNRGADIVAVLLSRGAAVNIRASDGSTPLHKAASIGSPRFVSMLIGAGADVNAADRGGTTPLHIAAKNGRKVAVRALLAAGADPKKRNRNGQLPVDVARNNAIRKILNRSLEG